MNDHASFDPSDRREVWEPAPRPDWAAMTNKTIAKLDIEAIVPLDEQSLMDAARRSTGLDDFGEDGWREHFAILVRSMREEAKLNFLGRVIARSELARSLEARLRVEEAYRRHPEISDEVIKEPVFILGMGRGGTTILHETLSQDPRFGTVTKRDAMFPAGNGGEGEDDLKECSALAQGHVDVLHAISPELRGIHAMGADLPVEDIEFSFLTFFSDIWLSAYQVPSYQSYLIAQPSDYVFYWHKRLLKLLQWRNRRPHWLLKNPAIMRSLPELLAAYPDAKLIFPHRDPVRAADSVVNCLGAVYHTRTDHPYAYGDVAELWTAIGPRVAVWDNVIDLMENGSIRKGYFANSLYNNFMDNPAGALTKIYADLGLELKPDVLDKMVDFLARRHQIGHGNRSSYAKSISDDARTQEERKAYERYQTYFGVPNDL